MQAQYTHQGKTQTFQVALELREDNTLGPPRQVILTERSCPKSAPVTRVLDLSRHEPDLAVYRVREA